MRRLLSMLILTAATASCSIGHGELGAGTDSSATPPDFVAEEFASARESVPSDDSDVPADRVENLRTQLFESGGADSDLALHMRHEEVLAACMRAQGFEYIPLPYPGNASSPRFGSSLEPEEFARLYGYGFSTLYEAEELASAVGAATYLDPNESIRAAMSDAELAAYYDAFYGPPATDTASEDGSYMPADPSAGCSGEAAAVYGGLQTMDISDEARAELFNIEQVVQSDPAVRAAQKEWARCMAAAGYEVATPADAVTLVDSWLSPVLATSATKTVTTTDSNGNSITVEVPDLDADQLVKVQQREIDLAVTDLRCDQYRGLSETTAAVRKTAQEQAISNWYGELSESG